MMDDLISRQAAIDALDEYFERIGKLKRRGLNKGEKAIRLDAVGAIKTLPSAVVRCRDCKWWSRKNDSPYGYCHAMKHAYHSRHWEIDIYRTYKDDWFCADGERKDGDPDA